MRGSENGFAVGIRPPLIILYYRGCAALYSPDQDRMCLRCSRSPDATVEFLNWCAKAWFPQEAGGMQI
jgi:hypothetical protein